MPLDSTRRFSSRVENYIKYRPSYPAAILDLFRQKCGLTANSTIADIGSGTGILTEVLLKGGNPVFGVEPNPDMREAAERLLKSYPCFTSISATAEVTTLKSNSIDLITVGQAFHWFDHDKCRTEFYRVLKPDGWIALIWNDRQVNSHPFLAAYEDLLKTYGNDYESVGHKHVESDDVAVFFKPGHFEQAVFPSAQHFDFAGLQGRLLSSSYAPEAGQPKHLPMLAALRAIFDQYQTAGKVTFEYDTSVYLGQLAS